ncbi:sensor histidine kinase [Amycolatopsis thailandensis]|nr:histidine kinase [Amycolatopsis thailandensis]
MCVALLPVLAAFGVLGAPWSWTNPWSWAGLALIGVPVTLALAHPVAEMFRRLILQWTSVRVESGFRPLAEPVRLATGFWWNGVSYERSQKDARMDQRVRRISEPAYWREVRWVVLAAVTIGIVGAVPCAAVIAAIVVCASTTSASAGIGVCLLVVGLSIAPWTWRLVVPLARRWLAPAADEKSPADWKTQRADLSAAHDAEIRRIERDLHDGAQARLVAVGLDLAAAERLVKADPERAEAMLKAAREGTRASLNELRDLVRGVYPPVLVERGLVPAIRAAALDGPLDVTVTGDDGLRLPSPLAAALFFATGELLTNVTKHAHTDHAAVTIASDTEFVTITVRDTGAGGASPRPGSGLDGIRRRLDVFDAVLDIHSPVGGPTTITVRMPCASF